MSDKRPSKKPIKSAKQAEEERRQLQSYWSEESQLTQRTLIYVAELLEKLVSKNQPRKKTAYQNHVTKVLSGGGTMAEAAQTWRETKRDGGDSERTVSDDSNQRN